MGKKLLIVGMGIFAVAVVVIAEMTSQQPEWEKSARTVAATKERPVEPGVSESVAKERFEKAKAIFTTLKKEGVFRSVRYFGTEAFPVAEAVVGPRFYSLPFDEKQTFAGVVALLPDGGQTVCPVTLRDWRTNHEIGSFSKDWGLRLE